MNKKNSTGLDKLFGSKSRVKLLQLLFTHTDQSFYVREITRLVDEQVNSVRRELNNMQDLGVVRSDTKDNKLYYAVNQKYEHYDALKLFFAPGSSKTAAPSFASNSWNDSVKSIKNLVDLFILIDTPSKSKGVGALIVGDNSTGRISKWASLTEKKLGHPFNYTILAREDYYYRHRIRDRFIHDILARDFTVVIDKEILTDGEKNV